MKAQLVTSISTLLVLMTVASQAQFVTGGLSVLRVRRYTDVQGSPFLYPSWRPGTVTDSAENVYTNQLIKFDSHLDEVQLTQNGKTVTLNSVWYPKFEFEFTDEETGEKTRRSFRSGFTVEDYTTSAYFEVLFDGNYKFLKKTKTDYMDQNVNSYGSANSIKRFITKIKYYVVDKSGKSFEIRLSKKSLLEALGSDKDAAEAHIGQTGVKVRTESSVIGVLNALQQP